MTKPLPIREAPAMNLAGLRRVISVAAAGHDIPKLWMEFHPYLSLPVHSGNASYGVLRGSDEKAQTMDYMVAMEVTEAGAVPPALERLRLPAQRYAIFTHDGTSAKIRQTWDQIWKEWLPTSGFRLADSPPFERYGPKYDVAAGRGDTTIWVPVVKA